jgi:SAM-dependent methyltransferase
VVEQPSACGSRAEDAGKFAKKNNDCGKGFQGRVRRQSLKENAPNPSGEPMTLSTQDLHQVSNKTLDHYNQRADDFWEGTRGHDVSQNITTLLQYIDYPPPFSILDFGCGPGRDLGSFTALGHVAIGLEGAERFAAMARQQGYEVWQQDFLNLDLPKSRFDGVFANASLFHVPSQEMPRVLGELHATLKPRGVLFSSNPHGHNEEGWNKGRYGAYHDLETWRCFMLDAGYHELTHYYRPDGQPREQQGWLASAWRKEQA